jgi:hypothetical protein
MGERNCLGPVRFYYPSSGVFGAESYVSRTYQGALTITVRSLPLR